MNKKLLETRLRSIEHYLNEIKLLEDAIKVTKATREDLINSINEFFPFKVGDVIGKEPVVVKIALIKGVQFYSKPRFELLINTSIIRYSELLWSEGGQEYNIPINEIDDWRLIISAPEAESDI